jgi:hypothetical protein
VHSLDSHISFIPADLLEGRRGRPTIGVWIRTLLYRRRLDALLLRGVARHQSAELALRARRLTTRRRRRALADSLDEAILTADGRGPRLVSIRPLARQVHAARPALRELADALRAEEEVEPAGVLLARRMLTDGAGPLYHECGDDVLRRAAEQATAALQGHRPVSRTSASEES